MEPYKAIDLKQGAYKGTVHIPAWADKLRNLEDIGGSAQAFAAVPLVYRAVQLRASAMSRIPVRFYEGETELDEWPFESNFEDLIWKTEAGLMLAGAGYWLRRRNSAKLLDAQWLNPFTVTVKLEKRAEGKEEIDELIFKQEAGGRQYGPWKAEDMAYFREFNPGDDIGPGVAPAVVALGNSRLHDYATRFAGEFFKGGAMPTLLLSVPSSTSEAERKRIENWFSRAVTGVAKAFRVLAVRSEEIKPNILTPPIKDLAMPELMQQARQQVALAFGIPQTMLEDAANYATAAEHRLGFWSETIVPRIPMYERVINGQFLRDTNITAEFRPEELDVMQEDESERANSLNALTLAGVPLKIAMEVLGYDLDEDQWAAIEERSSASRQPVPSQFGGASENEPEEPDDEQIQELRRWERFALKRLKEGKAEKTGAFETSVLPSGVLGWIQAQLEACRTEFEIRSVFKQAAEFDMGIAAKPEADVDKEVMLKLIDLLGRQSQPFEIKAGNVTVSSTPDVHVAAPIVENKVSVEPTPVQIEVKPADVEIKPAEVKVNVEPTPVTVINQVPKLSGRRESQKVKRDRQGQIDGSETQVHYEYEE
jgi:HK97 family phage portal protein